MRELHTFDLHNDEGLIKTTSRVALRAIIIQNGKLAMIQSNTFNECKFPGGGLEEGETHTMCLIREVQEEAGLIVIPSSIQPYGSIREKRKSTYDDPCIFEMTSYYYVAHVESKIHPLNLDHYEKEYGYHMVWLSLDEAISINEKAMLFHHDVATWIERELFVLKRIKQEGLMEIVHS